MGENTCKERKLCIRRLKGHLKKLKGHIEDKKRHCDLNEHTIMCKCIYLFIYVYLGKGLNLMIKLLI